MLANLTLSALFLLLTEPGPNQPFVSPEKFREWFDVAVSGKLSLPEQVKAAAQAHRYVFVGGFLNEAMSAYFKQNVKELRAIGVPRVRSTSFTRALMRHSREMRRPSVASSKTLRRWGPKSWS